MLCMFWVFLTQQVITTLAVGERPMAVSVQSELGLAYDLCEFAVIGTAIFNAPADKIILLEREDILIASHPGSDAVAFFNLETGALESEISVGRRPEAIAVLRTTQAQGLSQ